MRVCASHCIAYREKRPRSGLTIIELLAATALATALVVAVLGVLQSMTRAQQILLGNDTPEPWHARLAEQLEWDLVNSTTVRTTAEGFQLAGFAGRSFSSGAPEHLPTVVEYRIARTEKQSSLVRYETHVDSRQLDNRRAEIVCTAVDVITIGQSVSANATDDPSAPSRQRDQLNGPLPDRVTVTVYRADAERPVFSHAISLR